jgi:hypothetical protein
MSDEFQFGERAKLPARLGGSAAPPKSSIPVKLVGVVGCLAVVAAAAFVFQRKC